MPRVARYSESTDVPSPRLSHRAEPDLTADAALDALADGLETVGAVLQQEAEADAVSWTSRVAAEARVYWARREAELQATAADGAPGHTRQLAGEWEQWLADTLAQAPNDLARDMATDRLSGLWPPLSARAVLFQHGAVIAQRVADFGLTVDALAEAVRIGAMGRDEALTQFDGDLDAAARTWMLPETAGNWRARRDGVF